MCDILKRCLEQVCDVHLGATDSALNLKSIIVRQNISKMKTSFSNFSLCNAAYQLICF